MLQRCARLSKKKCLQQIHGLATDLRSTIVDESQIQLQRSYAKVPAEYQNYYGTAKQAIKKPNATPPPIVQNATESSSQVNSQAADPQSPPDRNASTQQFAAESATRWMFPWEKRQMSGDKGPLRSWEKLYWGVFVSAIAFLLWTKLLRGTVEETPDAVEDKAEKERKKIRAARLLLAGQTLSDEDDEQLDGMTPQEIQSFVETTSINPLDPFEGLSPAEINDLLSPPQPSSTTLQIEQ